MLNIKLIDNWRLRSDSSQFMLVKVREKGNEIIDGYFNSIESCIWELIERKIKSFDATSISELLESIKSFQTALNQALQPLKLRVVGCENQNLAEKIIDVLEKPDELKKVKKDVENVTK